MVHQQDHPKFLGAVILNISDAGLKLIIDEQFDIGEIITISFIGQKLLYKATGRVIRLQPVDHPGSKKYEIGIRFTAIHQEFRES